MVLGKLLQRLLALTAAHASIPPPTFEVNMMLPPRARYRGAVRNVLDAHPAEHSFEPVFAHWNKTFWHQFSEDTFGRTARALKFHFPERAEEMMGIAEELQANGLRVSFEYLSAWAYRHELQHASIGGSRACTGIVVQAADGSITHGRNEDLDPWVARNLTLSLSFIGPSRQLLLQGADWYWFSTGLRTAARPGTASLSGNFRFAPPRPLAEVLEQVERGVMPDMLLFRHSLQEYDSFEALLEHLATAEVATPSYYVLAGVRPGEGAVISRSPNASAAANTVIRLGSPGIVGAPPHWALVQTNYDLWAPDPLHDPRRSVATSLLASYGQSLGAEALGLFAALSSYPVHNTDTAYTSIMSARTGSFVSLVRTPMVPAHLPEVLVEA